MANDGNDSNNKSKVWGNFPPNPEDVSTDVEALAKHNRGMEAWFKTAPQVQHAYIEMLQSKTYAQAAQNRLAVISIVIFVGMVWATFSLFPYISQWLEILNR